MDSAKMVYHLLTDRQAEYLRHRCAGLTDAEAAAAMGLRTATLAGMRSAIRERLGVFDIESVCREAGDAEPPRAVLTRPMVERPVAPATAPAQPRRLRAMVRRNGGERYEVIGRELGVSPSTAHDLVRRGAIAWLSRHRVRFDPDAYNDQLLALIQEEELAAVEAMCGKVDQQI